MTEALFLVLVFFPLIAILWLANLADVRRAEGARATVAAGAAIGLTAAGYGLLFAAGVGMQVAGMSPDMAEQIPILEQMVRAPAQRALVERMLDALPRLGRGLWISSGLGLALLLPLVRRGASRVLDIDPARTVHAVALSFTMLILVNLVFTLGVGLDMLAEAAESQAGNGGVAPVGIMMNLWVQQGLTALLAAVGVGWLCRRSAGDVLARLGIVPMSGRQLLLGISIGLLMVLVVSVLSGIASMLGLGTSPDVESLSEALLGPLLNSIPGILTIGLAAAIGEETLFRGALQPRFGLVLAALLFAITHSNYGLSFSTFIVFVVGIVFGLLRRHQNTTTSMVAHAAYNTTLGLMAMMAIRFLENMNG